jgi:K+-sensing histidine kinase KdpD
VTAAPMWAGYPTSALGRYTMALGMTVLALLGRWLLNPFLHDFTPFITLYPTVAFLAIYVGLGPSLLAAVLGAIGAAYWFVPPRGSFALSSVPHIVGTAIYFVVCGLIILAGEKSRKSATRLNAAFEKLQKSEQELRGAKQQLENQVQHRTLELEGSACREVPSRTRR